MQILQNEDSYEFNSTEYVYVKQAFELPRIEK